MIRKMPRIGILGGGQLGKMLALAAHPFDLSISMLDKEKSYPGAPVSTHFVEGNFKNYDDVMAFGEQVDVITVEIEHVNVEALKALQEKGKIVHPDPNALATIMDKGLQKQFYEKHQLPTSPFSLFAHKEDLLEALEKGDITYPFVQKSRTAGYDGNGVALIKTEKDISKLLNGACLIEPLVDIEKEIAVVAARNADGEIKTFRPVEMQFNDTANLVEFLFSPAHLSDTQSQEVQKLASTIIETFSISGLLAVEFFLTTNGEWLINEVAPRPHNSGHHTIDSAVTSQFEQHIRAILNFPLGDVTEIQPAVMINLLGAEGYKGPVRYQNLDNCLATSGAHLHLYGKTHTRPFRKMGHVTVVDEDLPRAIDKARTIQKTLKIISDEKG